MARVLVRFLIGVVVILGLVFGPGLYGSATAGARLSPALENSPGPVNVTVILPFKPQLFHQQQLEAYGVFAGTNGNRVNVLNVSQDGLHAMAAKYWVKQIVPFKPA
ncbi:MAG: hypothetical protein J2P24_00510 [Streptosporangiales bacterium]|nr:hypothetical protein [Streptosporangiales bacterium]MBO0892236.1 hypothetical protein [Acidothermales bacterium]